MHCSATIITATCYGGTESKTKFFQETKTQCTIVYGLTGFCSPPSYGLLQVKSRFKFWSEKRWRRKTKKYFISQLEGMEHLYGNIYIC